MFIEASVPKSEHRKRCRSIWAKQEPPVPVASVQMVQNLNSEVAAMRFIPSTNLLELQDRTGGTEIMPTLILKNPKMFCLPCDGREAFSLVWSNDLANELAKASRLESGSAARLRLGAQLLYLAYQCQHCKGEPIGVLIKREEWQLWLHGRSPMEEVEVPSFIPRPERHPFRDALVAMHDGKTLAAVLSPYIY